MYGKGQKVSLANDGVELVKRINPYFNRTREHYCSHRHAPSSGCSGGPGMVESRDGIYISWNIFGDYAENGELICRKIVTYALDKLLGNKKVLITNLQSMGVATLMKQENRYIAHLLYAIPTKRGKNVEVIEDIYPIHNVRLSLNVNENIKKTYLAPQMTELNIEKCNGRFEVNVPTVECHQMVVFEW